MIKSLCFLRNLIYIFFQLFYKCFSVLCYQNLLLFSLNYLFYFVDWRILHRTIWLILNYQLSLWEHTRRRLPTILGISTSRRGRNMCSLETHPGSSTFQASSFNHYTTQLTQNSCIPFIQCLANVFDVGQTLYKCYANVFTGQGPRPQRSERARELVHWLKLVAWKVGDRVFEPPSGLQVSKKQNVSSPLTRKDSIFWISSPVSGG